MPDIYVALNPAEIDLLIDALSVRIDNSEADEGLYMRLLDLKQKMALADYPES